MTAVADTLLVNLLQNEYNVKNLLGSNESVGLEAILVPLKNLVTPPHEQLVYSRARDWFVQVFQSFVKGSEEIIPGSSVTYSHLLTQIHNLPESVRQETHNIAPKVEVVHKEEVVQHVEEEKHAAESKPVEDWNAADEDDEHDHDEQADEAEQEAEQTEEQPTVDQLVEEDVKKDMIKGKKEFLKNKGFVDEDGFIHVKPHERPSYEHEYLRGRGRRGKKGRHGETDRIKVRGGKGPRGFITIITLNLYFLN